MRRCSISLIIREMQIKTTIRNYFTPTKTAIIKKRKPKPNQTRQKITSIDEDVEKLELLYTAGRNVI